MIRRTAASLAALAMLLILAVPVIAGGWAEIVADGQTTKPPVEGQPTEVGFKVMQHGVTPAPWETATVHFVDMSTGETIEVKATNDNPNGHFVATATLPRAGYWTWQVTLQDLVSEQVPVTLAVRTANGRLPVLDSAATLSAIDRAKAEVRTELSTQLGGQIEDLRLQVDEARSGASRLAFQIGSLRAERDKLVDRISALETGEGGLPIVGVISLAVLAGAAAGFAMAWLAGRPGPAQKVALSPAPRGADPA
jgi:hypothetical protein